MVSSINGTVQPLPVDDEDDDDDLETDDISSPQGRSDFEDNPEAFDEYKHRPSDDLADFELPSKLMMSLNVYISNSWIKYWGQAGKRKAVQAAEQAAKILRSSTMDIKIIVKDVTYSGIVDEGPIWVYQNILTF